jgi:hypothetical protein
MDNWNTYNPENIMTFNNIHIDHIKPISRFNLKDYNEFLDCCNYTNLQPLLAIDNLRKIINGQKKIIYIGMLI